MKTFKFLLKAIAVGFILMIFAFSSSARDRKKASVQEVTFIVGLHCENCVKKVQDNIPFEKGVKDLKVSLDEKTVWILYSPDKTSKEKLAAAIEELGYEVKGEAGTEADKEK